DVGLDLHGAEGGGGIGREVGVAGTCSEDYDAALFEMADGAAANVGFGDLVHFDGGHDAAVHVTFLERVLQGERVDDGAEQAHVVGGAAVHLPRRFRDAAKEVAAADDDGHFDAQATYLGDLRADLVNGVDVHTEAAAGSEGFA